jgi:hypothetical protein
MASPRTATRFAKAQALTHNPDSIFSRHLPLACKGSRQDSSVLRAGSSLPQARDHEVREGKIPFKMSSVLPIDP